MFWLIIATQVLVHEVKIAVTLAGRIRIVCLKFVNTNVKRFNELVGCF